MADVVMADIVMAYVGMTYIGMAYVVLAYAVMASCQWCRVGTRDLTALLYFYRYNHHGFGHVLFLSNLHD